MACHGERMRRGVEAGAGEPVASSLRLPSLVSYIVTMINPALTLVFTFIAPSSRIAAGAAAGRAVPPPADRNLARPRLPPPLFEVSEVFRNFPATPSGAGRRAALIPV